MATKTQDRRIDPLTLADLLRDPQDAPHGFGAGRTWTPREGAKRVRSIARDSIDRFGVPGYKAHAYTDAEAALIVAEVREHSRGSGTTTADAIRAEAAPKAKAKPRKAAPKAASVPQDATEGTVTA